MEPLQEKPLPTFIEALVVNIEPQHCSALVKRLTSELPLLAQPTGSKGNDRIDLSHLKRVKRRSSCSGMNSNIDDLQKCTNASLTAGEQCSKKRKLAQVRSKVESLDVLLGSFSFLERKFGRHPTDPSLVDLSPLQPLIAVENVKLVEVPSRPAESEEEWKHFNELWPTVYLPNKTKEYLEQDMQISESERDRMRSGMEAALEDAEQCQRQYRALGSDGSTLSAAAFGVIIQCPQTGSIVGTASQERDIQWSKLQQTDPHGRALQPNPLSTPFVLASQAVSRLERQTIVSSGSGTIQNIHSCGQYLCTGYDVYSTLEPTIFEAMALVHSRIRRLVFGCARRDTKQFNDINSSGILDAHVNALPGTNHHYRSFLCHNTNPLQEQCRSSSFCKSNL